MQLKFLLVLLFGSVMCGGLSATDHNLFPMDFWELKNYCTEPIVVTITNENGQIELEKTLLGGELFTQKMGRSRRLGEVLRKTTVHAYRANTHSSIDAYIGNRWKNGQGTVTIKVPYFYYNQQLDRTGCMK